MTMARIRKGNKTIRKKLARSAVFAIDYWRELLLRLSSCEISHLTRSRLDERANYRYISAGPSTIRRPTNTRAAHGARPFNLILVREHKQRSTTPSRTAYKDFSPEPSKLFLSSRKVKDIDL